MRYNYWKRKQKPSLFVADSFVTPENTQGNQLKHSDVTQKKEFRKEFNKVAE